MGCETSHRRALSVEGGEDVVYGAVLATGVHRLQHDQQRVLVLGIEQRLQPGQLLPEGLQFGGHGFAGLVFFLR